MRNSREIRQQFEDVGGEFTTSVDDITTALSSVRVFMFDWDGVFNDGMKFGDKGSPFGEADSMGVNLLRLSFWMKHGRMPLTGILTGATNEAAEYFTRREGLEFCVRGFTDKRTAFAKLCEAIRIEPTEVAFMYDDVLDLPVAQVAAVRCCIRRPNSALFMQYIRSHGLCDYISAAPGGQGAVRECCELMIGLGYDYDSALAVRMEYGPRYQEYLKLRKSTETLVIAP